MGQNTSRNITFKPLCRRFGPLEEQATGTLQLHEDELESLYLADYKGLYQETCARKLGVSRPTFAKIVKSARRKTAEMLMFAKEVELIKKQRKFILIFPTNDRINVHPYFITAKYYAFATVESDVISSIAYKENPIYKEMQKKAIEIVDDNSAKGLAAGQLVPPLLTEGTILIVASLGDGMRRNIEGMGINIKYTDEYNIDKIVSTLL